jgi:hypothetical protein
LISLPTLFFVFYESDVINRAGGVLLFGPAHIFL